MIIITIPGEPIGKGRPRLGRRHTYTPEKTQRWEQAAAWEARRQHKGDPLEGPIDLDVRAVFAIPKSWPKWKREAAEDTLVSHTVKPDASNVLKAVEDALNGIAFRDDSQISSVTIIKWYGSEPCVQVVCSTWDNLHSKSKRSELKVREFQC